MEVKGLSGSREPGARSQKQDRTLKGGKSSDASRRQDLHCHWCGLAKGIGRATARLFALHGGRVIILDLDGDAAAAAAPSELGDAHRGYACDVTDKAACEAAVDKVVAEFGRVDVLINNAGITQPVKFLAIDAKGYDAILDVNLRGTLYMSRGDPVDAAAEVGLDRLHVVGLGAARRRHLRRSALQRGQGRRARSRQGDGARVRPGQHPRQLGDPGLIQTDITGDKLTPELRTEILKGIPMNRLGDAEDVARACLFLASDLASYTTGAVIDVNGGMLIH